MKKLFAALLGASSLLVAGQALPCGAPFGAGVNVDPKQDILLAHKGDQETYVFQPTFCGDAKDFGVILPVPSLLTGAPTLADANMFGVADTISAPEVVEKTECRSRGGGLDAGAGSFGDAGDGTTVVASGKVGFLDWAQLEAKDEASFTSWLDANGYPYDAKAKAAFGHYVGKKWFFVAFKVSNGAAPAGGGAFCKSLGPIRLQFTSATPVVPSRMATVGATTGGYGFSWRVFAITEGKEQLGFVGGTSATRTIGFAGVIPATQVSRFDGLAGAGDRLTKLTLWFDTASTADVALELVPPSDRRELVQHVTYVDCPEPGDGGVVPGADTGAPADDVPALTGASGGGRGCATGGGPGPSAAAVALVLVGLARRRRS